MDTDPPVLHALPDGQPGVDRNLATTPSPLPGNFSEKEREDGEYPELEIMEENYLDFSVEVPIKVIQSLNTVLYRVQESLTAPNQNCYCNEHDNYENEQAINENEPQVPPAAFGNSDTVASNSEPENTESFQTGAETFVKQPFAPATESFYSGRVPPCFETPGRTEFTRTPRNTPNHLQPKLGNFDRTNLNPSADFCDYEFRNYPARNSFTYEKNYPAENYFAHDQLDLDQLEN